MSKTVKRYILFIAAFLYFSQCFTFGSIAHAADVPAKGDDLFRQQNDILYYDDSCSLATPASSTSTGTTPSGSGGGGGCGEQGYGSGVRNSEANKQQIWSFLKNKGLTDEAAAGIMGNAEQESSFMPDALNNIGCLGFVQWCPRSKIDNFAAQNGGDPTCLGTQLEFLWDQLSNDPYESKVKKSFDYGITPGMSMVDAMNQIKDPGQAAVFFEREYERSNVGLGENLGRDTRADKLYKDFTGKDPDVLGSSPTGSGSSASCPNNNTPGGIPSANCQDVQSSFQSLVSSGKVTLEIPEINDDVAKCSEQPIERCTGGARPQTVRAISAIAQNSGVDTMRLWNINEKHGCDQFDHPAGLATDIKQANGVECASSNPEECKKMFDYIINNGDELDVKYVIWNGSYCEQMKATSKGVTVYCNNDHNDHIHLSLNG